MLNTSQKVLKKVDEVIGEAFIVGDTVRCAKYVVDGELADYYGCVDGDEVVQVSLELFIPVKNLDA